MATGTENDLLIRIIRVWNGVVISRQKGVNVNQVRFICRLSGALVCHATHTSLNLIVMGAKM